jgi:hypothetical protein
MTMIAWPWLLLAFSLGGFFGVMLVCLLSIGRAPQPPIAALADVKWPRA